MATEAEIFRINFGDTLTSIARLKEELKETRKAFEAATTSSEAFSKGKEVKNLENQIKSLTSVTKDNTNALGGVNVSAKFAAGSYGELKQKIEESKKSLLSLTIGSKEFDAEQKNLIALQEKRISIESKLPSLFQKRIKGAIDESLSLKQLNEQVKINEKILIEANGKIESSFSRSEKALEKLNKELSDGNTKAADAAKVALDLANKELEESSKRAKEAKDSLFSLNQAIQAQSNSVKGLRSEMKSLNSIILSGQDVNGEAAKRVAELKDRLDDLKDETVSLKGTGIERLNASVGLLTDAFQNLDLDKAKTGFKALGTAMSAIPLILLIEGIKALIDNFDEVVKFVQIFTGETNAAKKQVKELTIATEQQTIANNALIASYDREIQILTASGASEQKLLELKKKKIAVQILEQKQQLKLNSAKVAEVMLNDDISETLKKTLANELLLKGQIEASKSLFEEVAKDKKERYKEDLKAASEAAKGIYDLETELLVLSAENQKKQNDKRKENLKKREEDLKKESDLFFENALYEAKLAKEIDDEQLRIENDFLKNKKDLEEKYRKEGEQLLLDQAQIELNKNESDIQAQIDFETTKYSIAINNKKLTNEQLILLEQDYQSKVFDLKQKEREQTAKLATDLIMSFANIGAALAQTDEEAKAVQKSFALASIAINTGLAISNLTATSFSPSSPDNILTGGLAAYAKLAAGLVTITSNILQAKNIINSFEEGGYTGNGNPHEVSTNLGQKPYTYHKSEYVIPAPVLRTDKGKALAMQAESLRRGISKLPSGIDGFFDGGYTAVSTSASTVSAYNANNSIAEMIRNLPTPVVKVTDINKVNESNALAIKVSSL